MRYDGKESKGVDTMSINITDIFGTNVFSVSVMEARLPANAFAEVRQVMEHGGNITMATANIVAEARCV